MFLQCSNKIIIILPILLQLQVMVAHLNCGQDAVNRHLYTFFSGCRVLIIIFLSDSSFTHYFLSMSNIRIWICQKQKCINFWLNFTLVLQFLLDASGTSRFKK